ncbi:MAG: bifunctional diguanylate cyclase/phosphodiesterase, partial [Roseibium sp.]
MRDLSAGTAKLERDFVSEKKADLETGRSASAIFGLSSSLVVLLMFCAVIFSFGLVLFKIVVAERAAAQREISSVSRFFENHKLALLKEMERYAASNAAYVHIETRRS